MNTKAIKYNAHIFTSVCVFIFVSSVIAYMYFLSLSVVHVVMRKEATQQVSQLRSDIADLESSYIEARHQISAKVANLDGFNHNQAKIFISKAEQSLVLRSATE
jgi:biopolymer transport protein ExbB/TolQ